MSGPPFPLHASVRERLHPDYVRYYNQYLINLPPAHLQPISESRGGSPFGIGTSHPLPVGRQYDYHIQRRESPGPDLTIRAFVPVDLPPDPDGWPAMIYFHGGGFVLGTIDSENTVCTHMCSRARCVVLTVDYRLAPEDPFPAAIDDAWEALLWTIGNGAKTLQLNVRKIAIGGASAGANLAAVITNRTLARPIPNFGGLICQLLVVPVTDNTATIDNNPSWHDCRHTASLTAEKMTWYRRHYLPNEEDWTNIEASPLLFQFRSNHQIPSTLVIVAELDILRHEGEQYANKLREAGADVDLHLVPGVPHPFLALDLVLEAGRSAITLLCETLDKAFDFR